MKKIFNMSRFKNKNKISKGFTLVEVVITVAIVGILAAIATPNFTAQAQKSRRTEAKNKLYEIMQREEKYMSENNTYTTVLTDLGYSSSPLITENGYYSISAAPSANGIADGVVLTAAPKGAQLKDTTCASYLLNSSGAKATTTSNSTCW